MTLDIGTLNELDPGFHHRLTCAVLRMSLAGDNQLNGTFGVGQNANEPLRVMQEQIWALVCGEPAGKAQRQGVGIEYTRCAFRVCAPSGKLYGEALPHEAKQFKTVRSAKLPQRAVRRAPYVIADGL